MKNSLTSLKICFRNYVHQKQTKEKYISEILEAIKEVEEGKTVSYEEVIKRLAVYD